MHQCAKNEESYDVIGEFPQKVEEIQSNYRLYFSADYLQFFTTHGQTKYGTIEFLPSAAPTLNKWTLKIWTKSVPYIKPAKGF